MPVTSVLLVLAACHETPPDATQSYGGVLIVDDDAIVFDLLDIGTDPAATQEVWISNAGPGVLTVAAPRIDRDGAFTVVGDAVVLQPTDAYAYSITFDPQSPFVHDATLIIDSDAEGPLFSEIPLHGEGLAPVFELDESTLDVGSVAVGCSALRSVVVRNTGNESLEVAPSLDGSSEIALVTGPMEILPGEQATVDVSYEPADGWSDAATLAFETSDPMRPHAEIEVTATGDASVEQVDEFEGVAPSADIVFVVDNSGSMTEEQAGLTGNMDAFVASLDAAGIDYRIGVLTTDLSGFVGDVITNATTDGATILSDQVAALGIQGNGTERGIQMLYNCAQTGGDCSADAGFLRDDALFAGIIISDEPDQSALSPENYVEWFQTLKSASDLFRVDAVVGEVPVPSCGTCASAGFGYDEAVALTGGTFLSVCADWNESLSLLGATAMRSGAWRFPLTAAPFVDTLEVRVDGAPADPKAWTYVEQSGVDAVPAIEFDRLAIPPPGAVIEVRYDEAAACE